LQPAGNYAEGRTPSICFSELVGLESMRGKEEKKSEYSNLELKMMLSLVVWHCDRIKGRKLTY
jgi:hypothetical protein